MEEHEFFVWVNPNDWMIKHQLRFVGSFVGGPVIPNGVEGPSGLPFIKNPAPNALEQSISPFHHNIIRNYMVEWNLELVRFEEFNQLPCRLHALFLLRNREDAVRYADLHADHVKERILKKGRTVGQYTFSVHDSAWIDFMRLGHSMDHETVRHVGRAYWRGELAEKAELLSMGKPWRAQSSLEVLFYGRIDFPKKELTPD